MRRIHRLIVQLLCLGVAFIQAGSALAADTPTALPTRPNIVVILTDDLSWNLVPYMPNVLKMQADGATFTRYFVTDSLCCPSRATILTGKFPHNTGVFTNTGDDGGFDIFERNGNEQQTFGEVLKNSGYATALMGKYLNGYQTARDDVRPGWTEWDVASDGYSGFNYVLNQNGALVAYGSKPEDYLTDVLLQRGIRFITESVNEGKPFILVVSTFAPHKPFTPAPRHAHLFPDIQQPRTPDFTAPPTRRAPHWLIQKVAQSPISARDIVRFDEMFRLRAQSVQAIDEMIDALKVLLRQNGLERNTYFLFTSDNGLHLGEHSLHRGKLTAFDHDIRVPLIVNGPGVPAGSVIDKVTENIDLYATFLHLAGVQEDPNTDGRSLVPLFLGKNRSNWRDYALIEHHGPVTDPLDPDYPESGGNPTQYVALRAAEELYVEYEDGEVEYYDLTTDPFELDSTASLLTPEKRMSLRATLKALRNCVGATKCWSRARAN